MYTLNLDIAQFLSEYWQKKPLLIKKAFPQFEDPISADELAGLACEEEISSRIVVTKDDNWEVVQGPFEDYDSYGETHWQLLVQAVNHWYPDSQPLVEALRFLPDWRFDDLMASFATPSGGVGPHVDNYDVFIIQGEGERHWTVGDNTPQQRRGGNPNSPLVEDFIPIIDVVLEKGDMLYIPPGFPHCGETLTVAMSYSIGFRAPSQQELISEVADYLLDNNLGQQRFTSQTEPSSAGIVSQDHQVGIMSLLSQLSQDPNSYQIVLGKLLSQNRFELDLCEGEEAYSIEDLQDAFAQGAGISRIGGLKVLRLENDATPRLFINGDVHELLNTPVDVIAQLSDNVSLSADEATEICQHEEVQALLLKLINQGFFYLSDSEE
ncbi:cupin domain-containing protein [Shewanella baltica]|uniref:ribosomal protein uL16 3-hydroxylase n=1 Tax=Shewanella baltica TaxID=62322 RepID=UPI00217DB6EE|nr:cupin domain-containing protein [Shewanella baltica]MCS6126200.1 cupin domain-containing protein [Shewanella baltica]MCS6138438.1 cupin domain-containing protein [Shewanella baltica]MCS6144306.1 cupin domain-containing protein [Shewanella baltica]MCS6168834.1 cupin domain-containing protein [Shewanella baltica]MCS6186192.1 cupin domain-containing protein [Shewanella baltica]